MEAKTYVAMARYKYEGLGVVYAGNDLIVAEEKLEDFIQGIEDELDAIYIETWINGEVVEQTDYSIES